MFKFKVGDQVQIRAGKEKGKKGKIEKVYIKENKIVVSGVNIYKRHKKATRGEKAGIFEVVRPLNVSNVAVICPKCSKTTRVGIMENDGAKSRICKKCKGVI